jgi:3-methyladenine DNA glycosylase AlkD
MKDQFEFCGIKSPKRKELTKIFIKKNGLPPTAHAESVITEIWSLPEREFQYATLDILERLVKKKRIQNVVLFEQLILSKSWWDTVDWLATRIVGVHFQKFPHEILSTHKRWMDSGNMWLQRVCILFQLKYKSQTDVKLLFSTIRRLAGSKEFFIQKAIGWALREYSKTDGNGVQKFIQSNSLAPLSVREGMRLIK